MIKPFRETFLNFPSDTLGKDALVVTVFLPEEKVPLRKDYPVLYVLGLGPKQAEEINTFIISLNSCTIVLFFKRKNTLNPNDIDGIILNVIEYFYIICGIFMPFVEITTNASFEMSDTMLMLLCAFIMFFIGEIGKIRLLRRLSYVWIVIPWLIFGMYHLFEIYYQHWGIRVIPSDIVVMFIWIKTLCYKICPSLGYLIIAFQIKKLIA